MVQKVLSLFISMLLVATALSVAAAGGTSESHSSSTILYSSDEWPMLYHDPQRTGFSSSDAPETNHTIWSLPYGPYSPPIVAAEKLFFKLAFVIAILNASDGSEAGLIQLISSSAVAVAGDKVLVAEDEGDGRLYCYQYNPSLHNKYEHAWNVSLGVMSGVYSPVVVDDHVYQAFQDDDGNTFIAGLHTNTGVFLWENISLGAPLTSDIVVDNGKIYCTVGHILFCYSASTGGKLWESDPVSGTFTTYVPAVADGRLYTVANSGVVYCFNLTTHEVAWQYATGIAATNIQNHPSIAYGKLYVGTTTKLVCLNIQSPDPPVWTYSSGGTAAVNPVVADGKVYAVMKGKQLVCLDAYGSGGSTTLLWKFDLASSYCPVIANGTVFYGDTNNVYAFHDNNSVNHPPGKPVITGPDQGRVGVNQTFTVVSTDLDGQELMYDVDWGDHTEGETYGPYPSGTSFSATHVWVPVQNFTITVTVNDSHGGTNTSTHTMQILENRAPSTPVVTGPTVGVPGVNYTFSAVATDPDGHQLLYSFQWGDSTSGNTSWVPSGTPVYLPHKWTLAGNYSVRAKATDQGSLSSNWSKQWNITITTPTIALGAIMGGATKVTAEIINTGKINATNVIWNITLSGGLLLKGAVTSGKITLLKTGETATVIDKPILGFGRVTIKVTASGDFTEPVSKTASGFVFLFFVLGVKET